MSASVQLGEWHIDHNFFVVNRLVAPVILGIDFLQRGELMLDFTSTPVKVTKSHKQRTELKQPQEVRDTPSDWQEIHKTVLQAKAKVCLIAAIMDPDVDVIDECTIPDFGKATNFEPPECTYPEFLTLVEEFKDLFCTTPGVTSEAQHFIPTTGNPVKVPPKRMPAQ